MPKFVFVNGDDTKVIHADDLEKAIRELGKYLNIKLRSSRLSLMDVIEIFNSLNIKKIRADDEVILEL